MSVAPSGVSEKQRRARRDLTAVARTLTAERGLAGFTVQELCDGVGVSRRSFFNYFSSKEDAVLGVARGVEEQYIDLFMAARPPGIPAGLSHRLIDDLADLAIASFDEMALTPADAVTISAALRREPSLLPSLLANAQSLQERFVDLVTRREQLGDDRATAEVAVKIVMAMVDVSAQAFLAEANRMPFAHILRSRLATASALLQATPPARATPRDQATPPARATPRDQATPPAQATSPASPAQAAPHLPPAPTRPKDPVPTP